ncbi:MAG: 50S ribosomal protein L22 [Alphaproteobacteria bacterium]|nr:50S ribosomal protein L22 [Alphaproteobacteria bacterium]MBN2780212.1 50S ribosomal protein L22 [Alphaproteobacteria bacterium]
MEKQARCFVKMIKTSPQKLNLVAGTIRNKAVGNALNLLTFSKKRIAGAVKKALMSAIANAENTHGMNAEKLVVVEAYVGKAMTLKRIRPAARGQAHRILKPFSNLTIIVAEQAPVKVVAKKLAKSEKNCKKGR